MKDFIFLFRQDDTNCNTQASPKEMEETVRSWQEWIGNIAAQGKLADHGNRLSGEGKVLKPGGVITDGPFVEIRERLGGFIVVKAEDLDDATTLAHGCPALTGGGSVEVRQIAQ